VSGRSVRAVTLVLTKKLLDPSLFIKKKKKKRPLQYRQSVHKLTGLGLPYRHLLERDPIRHQAKSVE
jgi:hypothetical protein